MADDEGRVTTFCPRCGKPIVWGIFTRGGVEALEVVAWGCFCQLTDDEWGDLGDEADEALLAREEG